MIIEREWAMPCRWTFDIKPIKRLLQQEMNGIFIDPFAGAKSPCAVKNDLNPKMPTAYHMDALEFLRMFETNSVDGVLYDPPYSPRQVKECYDGIQGGFRMERIMLVPHGGSRNDTICTIEVKEGTT